MLVDEQRWILFLWKTEEGGKKRFKTATLRSTYALTGPYFANLHKGYGVGASDNDGFGAK